MRPAASPPSCRSSRAAGASPLFPPAHPTRAAALTDLQAVLQEGPPRAGLARSRWTLAGLRTALPWLTTHSLSTVWAWIHRAHLSYKRGRRAVYSPDPHYPQLVARLARLHRLVARHPRRLVLLYEDELTYYRQPSVAQDYAAQGSREPRATQGPGYNYGQRIAGCLDVGSGQLISWQRRAFDHGTFLGYLQAVAAQYPAAWRIYIVLDNWPVHFHPRVQAGLRASRIELVRLPTYAPWLNPVEKVWRKLYQERLHHHRQAPDWPGLQATVQHWLDRYATPSPELLHYTGLLPN